MLLKKKVSLVHFAPKKISFRGSPKKKIVRENPDQMINGGPLMSGIYDQWGHMHSVPTLRTPPPPLSEGSGFYARPQSIRGGIDFITPFPITGGGTDYMTSHLLVAPLQSQYDDPLSYLITHIRSK